MTDHTRYRVTFTSFGMKKNYIYGRNLDRLRVRAEKEVAETMPWWQRTMTVTIEVTDTPPHTRWHRDWPQWRLVETKTYSPNHFEE